MDRITPLNDEEIIRLNGMLENVHVAVAQSMSYVRKFQGWNFEQLERKIIGVKEVTWRRYFRVRYDKMRPLHTVAAYSWLTMLPMPCFYRGLNIREAYPDMDDYSVDALIHSGLLPQEQFNLILSHLYHFLNDEQKQSVNVFKQALKNQYGALEDYKDEDFMFPDTLDIEEFAHDYYRSMAINIKKIRVENNIKTQTMAKVLNLSEYRYRQCENPENPVPLPIELGARLQVGLRLPDAMIFTSDMKTFSCFHTVRRVQQIRLNVLVEMLKHLDLENRKSFSEVIAKLSSMYLRQK